MDDRTEQANDTTLQDELLRNERVIQHPRFGAVKLQRPSPGQERQIAEQRRRQNHKDMQNDEILSRDEIEAIAIRRGMWTADLTSKIEELTRKTGEAMGLLDAIGYESLDSLLAAYEANTAKLKSLFLGTDLIDVIDRYVNLDDKPSLSDHEELVNAATSTEVDDVLDKTDSLRLQIELLQDMYKIRKELRELQTRQARLFVDAIEARSDRAEELARIYYCSLDVATEKPLWPTYEAVWDARPSDIEVLSNEMYYFTHGVTEEFKDTLVKYGFLVRQTAIDASSADSPDLPTPNSDGESQDSVLTPSSEASE